ncbi:MAG: type VI secretion system-associated protein TagF, partial [Pseudomonadota bacterium]|nr:type VI secretion system-associated protein TagF [Pseudomonadota bacterium]
DWLRRGVTELRATMPDEWRTAFSSAPAWNCVIPSCLTGSRTFIGVIAPSRDRVGREFPICAGVALTGDAASRELIADAHGWMWSLGELIVEARDRPMPLEAFDASLLDIPLPAIPAESGGSTSDHDILSVLGDGGADVATLPMRLAQALPWPELPNMFDSSSATSFWWTNAGAGGPLRGFSTDDGLAPSVMVTLMRPLTSLSRTRP